MTRERYMRLLSHAGRMARWAPPSFQLDGSPTRRSRMEDREWQHLPILVFSHRHLHLLHDLCDDVLLRLAPVAGLRGQRRAMRQNVRGELLHVVGKRVIAAGSKRRGPHRTKEHQRAPRADPEPQVVMM